VFQLAGLNQLAPTLFATAHGVSSEFRAMNWKLWLNVVVVLLIVRPARSSVSENVNSLAGQFDFTFVFFSIVLKSIEQIEPKTKITAFKKREKCLLTRSSKRKKKKEFNCI
jgi:hypothetical protein